MKLMPSLERYTLAAILCCLGFAIAWLSGAHSSALIVTVVVSGLYAGQGPGLFALALSALAFPTLLWLPPSSLSASPSRDARFAVFVVAALLVHRLIAAKQRSD